MNVAITITLKLCYNLLRFLSKLMKFFVAHTKDLQYNKVISENKSTF